MMGRAMRMFAIAFAFVALGVPAHATVDPFADWAAIVVAGDHEASDGSPSQGFDNARRDVSADLLKLGFARANLAEFSVRPREYKNEKLFISRPTTIMHTLDRLAARAKGGCLLYFSSHGEQEGVIVGEWIVPPPTLAHIVDGACGARPTVVVISACFSGVMLPALKKPNRMIVTAARRDRTSFGCGQNDRYPFFDDCILESWNHSANFPDLAYKARACVIAREKAEHLSPPSDPQIWIGPEASTSLPNWR